MTAVELEKNLREDYAKFVTASLISSVSGEAPGAEDEVGRGTPEAAILYCDTQVQEEAACHCVCQNNSKAVNEISR